MITLTRGLSNSRVTFQTTHSKKEEPREGRFKVKLVKTEVIRVNDRVLGIACGVRTSDS